jgi:predicted HicB family RNase H-like nuclease
VNKPSEYGISVRLVRADGEETYEARVAELPDVVAFGDTYGEAYEMALESVEGLQAQFAEMGRGFPAPEVVETDFSGRVTLRMSRSMHAAVHRRASMDGVSLNQWIVEAVACRVDNKMVSTDQVFVAGFGQVGPNSIGITIEPTMYLGSSGERSVFFSAGSSRTALSSPEATQWQKIAL